MIQTEAKLQAFASYPFTKLMLGFANIGDITSLRLLNVSLGGAYPNLQSLFTAASCSQTNFAAGACRGVGFTEGAISFGLSRQTWLNFGGSGASLQTGVCQNGINSYYGLCTVVRIGITGNEGNDCSCTDSAIGFGIATSQSIPVGVSAPCCGASPIAATIPLFGYIFAA